MHTAVNASRIAHPILILAPRTMLHARTIGCQTRTPPLARPACPCQGIRMRALVGEWGAPRRGVSAVLGRFDKRFFFGPFSPAALTEIPDPELPADDWVVL